MELFLFDSSKTILSSITNDSSQFKSILDNLDTNSYNKANTININGKKYILRIINLNNYNKGYLALLADYDFIVKPFKDEIIWLLSIFILTAILIIPLILYLSRIIIRPINALVIQSDKIKDKDYNVTKIDTNINEISLLSNSFLDMAKSISNHQALLEQKIYDRTKELHLKNKELRKLSNTDKLTSLYNRARLDSTLNMEFSRAKRFETIFSVIIMDIDFFKSVNDNFGHQTGDSVLKECASIFSSHVRETDTLGRWGGEEFLIICPNTSNSEVTILAEKIRVATQKHKFSDYPKVVTISLGIASFDKSIKRIEDLVANADIALYEAKKTGRNRVVSFNEI